MGYSFANAYGQAANIHSICTFVLFCEGPGNDKTYSLSVIGHRLVEPQSQYNMISTLIKVLLFGFLTFYLELIPNLVQGC